MSAKTKILIIRFSSIGDIVLCSPVIRILKKQWPDEVEIHFLTKKSFAALIENNVHVDKLWTINKSISEITGSLKAEKFDLIVDLHRNLRSSLLLLRLCRPFVRFNKLNFKKWLYVRFGWNLMPAVHIVERYIQPLSKYGITNDGIGLEYFYSPHFDSGKLNISLPPNYLVFALGGAHLGKKMSPEQWISAGNNAPYPVVLIGGKADAPESIEIESALGSSCINMCGKLDIDGSAYIVQHSDAVISGDTGMMHIAAAFKKKIISVWGCTVPEFGMYPYLPNNYSIILQPASRTKRPCSKLGNHCKYGMDNRCITAISAEEIKQAMAEILRKE